jgi:hypothetical protein
MPWNVSICPVCWPVSRCLTVISRDDPWSKVASGSFGFSLAIDLITVALIVVR